MVKYLPLIIWTLLAACNSKTGNNSKYTIAERRPLSERGRMEGKTIFRSYCASCHNPMKEATGPALNDHLIENRSDDWIYTLLTDQKKLKKDSLYNARVKVYGGSCTQFQISREELSFLLNYLRNPSTGCIRY